jgi:hypothetical protein
MNNWIKKSHLSYSLSFLLFIVSMVTTSRWSNNVNQGPIQFFESSYQLKITKYPFSLRLKNKEIDDFFITSIKLTDRYNHILPLDYLIESKSHQGRFFVSEQGLSNESYSFIISSHMRKDLRYKVLFKTKKGSINFSLFPLNKITDYFSNNKILNLVIKNKDLVHVKSNQITSMNKTVFFKSDMFTLNKIEDKSSNLKINKSFNNLKLSSANNEMFFSMNFVQRMNTEKVDAKVSFRTKSLK